MNNKLQTNKAFTLIELVVAIAILVLVTSFAGAVFRVSIDSHRTGLANAEIMQKLRAITDQFNRDFKGIRRDAPMAIQFRRDGDTRRDSIVFFANGDFQSIRQYWYSGSSGPALRTVVGNVASIYYGPASDPNILARKQKILTSDSLLIDTPALGDPNEFLIDSLAEWRVDINDVSFGAWVVDAPRVDLYLYLEEDLPLYMTDGVANFMIQIGEWDQVNQTFIWLPDNSVFDFVGDPDSDGNGVFGFFYNVPASDELVQQLNDWYDESANWPRAIRFTFTLYDSRGIIENGRTFTHIVYLGD